jgi:DNA-directed RNA polymerase subunit RPC12/RpoP
MGNRDSLKTLIMNSNSEERGMPMPSDQEKRNCPYCGGSIFAQAIKCRHCKESVEPIGNSDRVESSKECPHCGGMILAKAIKCKYCKEFIDQKNTPSNNRPPHIIEKRGNAAGNLKHWGYSAFYEGWIYFANDQDNGCIYKVHNAGSDIYKVSTISAQSINIVDGKIYFINRAEHDGIYTVNTDGSKQEKILDHKAQNLKIINDHMFFNGASEDKVLYRANLNGKKLKRICKENVWDYDVSEGVIYYCNPDDKQSLYRMDINGKAIIKLDDEELISEDNKVYIKGAYISDVIIMDDYVYFV